MEERVAAFLDHITEQRDLSANTRAAYRNDLSQLTRFLQARGMDDWHGDAAWVEAYSQDLMERGYSAATRARKVAAVRSFYRYLSEEGVVAEDPTQDLAGGRVERAAPTVLSHEQVAALFAAARERSSPEALRDQSILSLLYATGLRITEALGLDLDDIDREQRRLIVRGRKRQAEAPLDEACLDALDRYVTQSRPRLRTSQSGQAIYLNHRGQRLTRQGFWLALKRFARAANLPEVTPQTLRHTFAAHALEGQAPLERVRSMLGHSNVSSTRRYTQLTDDGAGTESSAGNAK